MDFRKYLSKAARQLDREVEKLFKAEVNEAETIDKKLVSLIKTFSKSCSGGKRIRGALVGLGYQIAGKRPQEIVKIGAAYEICHGAVLAHDDIIDQSLSRRNQPSLYQVLGGNHYGVSQAISLADYGFFLSWKIIAAANFSLKCKIKAWKLFSQILADTAWGQILDVEKADPLTTAKLKTARYTIAGPLQLGAVLAGARESLIKVLEEFGENLGIAFQIQDDILDNEVGYLGGAINGKKTAEQYKNQALQILPAITKDNKMSKLLEQMAEYLVQRTK